MLFIYLHIKVYSCSFLHCINSQTSGKRKHVVAMVAVGSEFGLYLFIGHMNQTMTFVQTMNFVHRLYESNHDIFLKNTK